jgi:hypothetical protein
MIVLRLGALAALAVVLYGQPKPKDVDGWDKIKWGMTIADARSAYRIETQPESKDNWTLLQLNPVKIGNVEMGIQVGARLIEKAPGSQNITSIRLWSFFGLPSSAPLAGPQDFDTLRTVLIEKYGRPSDEEVKRGENNHLIKTVRWTFPSTSIVMTLEQSALLPNVGTIYLEYTADPS